jgi:hypothetical protein
MRHRMLMWGRKALGWGWVVGWGAVVWAVASPWQDLGGIVHERLRWTQELLLSSAVILGFTAGRFGRDAVEAGSRRMLTIYRWVLYPAAGSAAAILVAQHAAGAWAPALVTVSTFAAWWAGLDLGLRAWPLLEGKPIRGPVGQKGAASPRSFRVAPETATPSRLAGRIQRSVSSLLRRTSTSRHR